MCNLLYVVLIQKRNVSIYLFIDYATCSKRLSVCCFIHALSNKLSLFDLFTFVLKYLNDRIIYLRREVQPRHFLLKCLYQARKVIGHVFVCQGYQDRKVIGHVFVCQGSCICVLGVMYLCVRGIDFATLYNLFLFFILFFAVFIFSPFSLPWN